MSDSVAPVATDLATRAVTPQQSEPGPGLREADRIRELLRRAPDAPTHYYSLKEAAAVCRRSEGTIRNLLSKYQLQRRLMWTTFRRARRRTVLLSPKVVAFLQQLTLEGGSRRERKTGIVVGRSITRGIETDN